MKHEQAIDGSAICPLCAEDAAFLAGDSELTASDHLVVREAAASREQAIETITPIIERMESRYPQRVIAAAVVDALARVQRSDDPVREALRRIECLARERLDMTAPYPSHRQLDLREIYEIARAPLSADKEANDG